MTNGLFDEMEQSNEISLQQILNNLLDGSKDLDLKSHIFKPKQLASLNILGKLLESLEFKNSNVIITEFINIYLRYMISFERMSRKEIIKALTSLMEERKSILKLTENMSK